MTMQVWSTREVLCFRAPIRFRLTDDERAFLRAGIIGTLAADNPDVKLSPEVVDAAVLEFTARLTFEQYRKLRAGIAELNEHVATTRLHATGRTLGDLLPRRLPIPPAQAPVVAP